MCSLSRIKSQGALISIYSHSDRQCLYTQEDRPCKRCSTAGKSCGPKTLARENETSASRVQAESHKPQPPRSHPWSASKPLLPRVLELVGPEMVTEVAAKLAAELVTLHSKVSQYPYFRPPSDSTRDLIPRLPELVDMTSPGQAGQRNSRAVSLPPNPELIHARPGEDSDEREEKKPVVIDGPVMVKTEPRQEHIIGERRTLGDGVPQFQPYW